MHESRLTIHDAVQLHVTESPGAAPPIVFAHGFTDSFESYLPIEVRAAT